MTFNAANDEKKGTNSLAHAFDNYLALFNHTRCRIRPLVKLVHKVSTNIFIF